MTSGKDREGNYTTVWTLWDSLPKVRNTVPAMMVEGIPLGLQLLLQRLRVSQRSHVISAGPVQMLQLP